MSSEQSTVDAATIEKTKQQIRGLVQEIAQLSRSDLEPEQYYPEVMQRIVTALAAIGGAVWTINAQRQLRLDYQINLSQHLLDTQSDDGLRHLRLLQQIITTREPKLLPPMSGGGAPDAPGNPTNTLLVLAPMVSDTDSTVEGVLEVFQRHDSQPAAQQGYLRFLVQMSELVGDWLKSRKLRHFTDRQSLWGKIDHFAKEVHDSLHVRQTAYTIANEGRRLVECDRLTVTVTRGRHQVVEAISGQDTLDTRSNTVALLRHLATRVCASGEPLWYGGTPEQAGDIPPQIEEAVDAYIDESHAKYLAVIPLRKLPKSTRKPGELGRDDEQEHATTGEVLGSLILEYFDTLPDREIIAPRVDLVCQHSSRALGNAIEHNQLFLMPLWRAIGQSKVLVQARMLPKTLLVAGLVLIVLVGMIVVRKDFELKAEGLLQPVERHNVFIPLKAEVEEVLVEHGDKVNKGDLLVKLRSNEIEREVWRLTGDLNAARERLAALEATPPSRRDPTTNTAAEWAQLVQQINSLQAQLDTSKEKQQKLLITSPSDGIVVSWDVKNTLRNRPVTEGQIAMEIADPSSEKGWELEVYLPEKRVGHLTRARQERQQEQPGRPLDVSYVLKSNPNDVLHGCVEEIHETGSMKEDHGQSFRIRVKIDKKELDEALKGGEKQGTEVVAQIKCGRASVAYCLFHELIEWTRIKIFAWF